MRLHPPRGVADRLRTTSTQRDPRLARRAQSHPRCQRNFPLGPLGRIDEPPSFGPDAGETTELWFSAPARMPCGLSLGAATVGGQLHLAFRYRHPLFSPDAARRFADRYLTELVRLRGEAGR